MKCAFPGPRQLRVSVLVLITPSKVGKNLLVLKYTEVRIYCQRQRCSRRSVVWQYRLNADIPRGSLVSSESAVVENANFLFRSLYLRL